MILAASTMSVDTGTIIASATALLTAVGAFFGAVKLLRDSGNAQSSQVVTSYKELAEELREQRKSDREEHARDMASVKARLDAAEAKIAAAALESQRDKSFIRRLMARITYLTSMLAVHAPGVALDPMPDDLLDL